jgi:acyl-CoA reductase-like NAD-dependent aldehyde dehydrogenase
VPSRRRSGRTTGPWSGWSAAKRGRTLAKFADLAKKNVEELAQIEREDVGKPIASARNEAFAVSLVLEYYAGAANKHFGETIPTSLPGLDFTLREPIGVVGLIVPWNFPLNMAAWKLGPALAAGNTVVLKPASYAPLGPIRLAELALEAGFPPGVVNVVTGPGGSAGAALAGHPGGGQGRLHRRDRDRPGDHAPRVGQREARLARAGRQEPSICFADADLARFAAESQMAVFGNAGQNCHARSRVLVERSVHEKVVELFAAETAKLVVGDPADEKTQVGSLISQRQRERVADYIDAGQVEGARWSPAARRPTTRRWPTVPS